MNLAEDRPNTQEGDYQVGGSTPTQRGGALVLDSDWQVFGELNRTPRSFKTTGLAFAKHQLRVVVSLAL
ncbi:MAG: hypothetical protein CL923_05155 [Deltaproteobacteria bacterium]|nr:hypothetical protein [Deltaproteobacteria bacterium]